MDAKIVKSLIDKNINSVGYNPKIVINENNKGVKQSLIENLRVADRFDIAVSYVVWSGFSLLKEEIKKFDHRSRFILTSEGLVTDPNSLEALLEMDIQVKVYDPYSNGRGFHLKSYLFEKEDMRTLMIGSNNISVRALGDVHEMAVEVDASENGYIIDKYNNTFDQIWNSGNSVDLTREFIDSYKEIFYMKRDLEDTYQQYQLTDNKIRPNFMQKMALVELEESRNTHDKGLVIAATGTGKTYLSAFDVENMKAKKLLFLVHNRLILSDAISTYERVFRDKKIIELKSSNISELATSDFVFTTDKTAYSYLVNKLKPDYFDYIVYDEAHKIGDGTLYSSIIEYFKPVYTLGITATPERTDNPRYLFETFEYNVPYEIRLLDAMSSELVCPFNYYGYDLPDSILQSNEEFDLEELAIYLRGIIKNIGHYGKKLKGLVFASSIKEANDLKYYLNLHGIRTEAAVSGGASEDEVERHLKSLQSNEEGTLEIIVTVNKFNEGVDIPDLNTIIMLRNTTSSIIYLQQLGRGLRRTNDPDKFVTVIDIIGNSKNNFTIAEVLTGNETRDKRELFKHVNSQFNEVSPFINVQLEEEVVEKIIRSITNDFKVETQLKRKFTDELERYREIPSLTELYLNPVFKELELLQLLFKNFHTPFSKQYKDKYKIEEDDLFVRNFFTFITQFVFRAYSPETLSKYIKLLKGEYIKDDELYAVLFPKESKNGKTTAINSNYHKVTNGFPDVFKYTDNGIIITKGVIERLKKSNAYELFLEHIELFETRNNQTSYKMEIFDLVDKGEFLYNSGATDCYMNVVGERIDHLNKVVYCTIKITEGESHYDNYIVSTDQIVYYTQSSRTKEQAESKITQFINEKYSFKICAIFPHLGYSNTSYFNLGDVSIVDVSDSIQTDNGKWNNMITFKLNKDIPKELLLYKTN